MSIWKFLMPDGREAEAAPSPSRPETDTVRKIVAALDALDPAKARYLAAFAFLLGRAANADHHISSKETRRMESIVMEQGGLPEEEAVLVVHMAKTQNQLFGGTENFLVTREFSKIADREQKICMLRSLFAVTAADGVVSTVEVNQISQIARELGLSHQEFIAVKLEFREHLGVHKKPGEREKPQ